MKILLVGAEPERMPRLKLVQKCLVDLGCEVEIFKAAKHERRAVVRYLINMFKLLFKRADVYHFFNIPDVIGLPLLLKRGKLVYDIRSPWAEVMHDTTKSNRLSKFAGYVERLFCRHADVVIAANPLLQQRAVEFGAKDCRVVPNFVFEELSTAGWKDLYLDRTFREEKINVLYIGKISKVEGSRILGDIIIDTYKQLDGDIIHYVIVGDGPDLDELKKRIYDAALGVHISFVGRVPHEEIGAYLRAAHFTIMPREEYGTSEWIHPDSVWKVNESIQVGTPVLATRIGGFNFEATGEYFSFGGIYFYNRHKDVQILSIPNDEFVEAIFELGFAINEIGKPDPIGRDWTICRDILKEVY